MAGQMDIYHYSSSSANLLQIDYGVRTGQDVTVWRLSDAQLSIHSIVRVQIKASLASRYYTCIRRTQ